jgi:hypothetical protein
VRSAPDVIGAAITDPDSKRRMLRVAADYEELSRRAEKRLRERGVTPKELD